MVLNTGLLDWESSALTTRPLHHLTLTGQNRILNKAMTLSNTGEDIMNGNSQNVVIYSNDGPSLNRTSNFVAQSFNTRDFCKNKKYLAELIQTTIEILSAATGMYTKTQIMAKIDFVKTLPHIILVLLK